MKVIKKIPGSHIENDFFDELTSYFEGNEFKDKTIVVSNDYKNIPETGNHVIAILTPDAHERGVIPSYYKDVGYVFKMMLHHDSIKNVYHIPLPTNKGFVGNSDIPILSRKVDVFFCGQVFRGSEDVFWKHRKNFHTAAVSFRDKYKDSLNVIIEFTKDWNSGYDICKYSDIMSNSKISLSPHGHIHSECIRFTESVACGCNIIAHQHPNELSLFNKTPAIYVEDWIADLETSVFEILEDDAKMVKNSIEISRLWKDLYSPFGVAMYIGSKIKGISIL